MNFRKSNPDFSIVIPTRNRLNTLRIVVEEILGSGGDFFEVIICDNATDDGTKEFCSGLASKDDRVRHIRSNVRLSMEQNWTAGLKSSRGDIVTIIGDDDGIVIESLSYIKSLFLRYPDINFVRSDTSSYWWPSHNNEMGRFVFWNRPISYEIRATAPILNDVLDAVRGYLELPMLYNGGYIRRSSIESLLATSSSRFYLSRTPDVFSGVLFATKFTSYLYLHAVTAVNGCCSASNGVSTFTPRAKRPPNSTASFWERENSIPYHPDIPLVDEFGIVPCGVFFVYEALLWLLPAIDSTFVKRLYKASLIGNQNYQIYLKPWRIKLLGKHGIRKPAQAAIVAFYVANFAKRMLLMPSRLLKRLSRNELFIGYPESMKILRDQWLDKP